MFVFFFFLEMSSVDLAQLPESREPG